ncbi:MAG: hypothetical protein QOD09_691, partial [Bradyrhizobium sp.]|nr:hypothetical protein [Bradyrhizobium sp.]
MFNSDPSRRFPRNQWSCEALYICP